MRWPELPGAAVGSRTNAQEYVPARCALPTLTGACRSQSMPETHLFEVPALVCAGPQRARPDMRGGTYRLLIVTWPALTRVCVRRRLSGRRSLSRHHLPGHGAERCGGSPCGVSYRVNERAYVPSARSLR